MAKFFKRYRRRYTKRNSERILRGGNTVLAAATQQVAYTYVAKEACVVKSIKLDVGATGGADVGRPSALRPGACTRRV